MKNQQDSEDIFLSDVLKGYKFWKKKVADLEKDNRDASKEKEYAESYRLMLNQYTIVEIKPENKQ